MADEYRILLSRRVARDLEGIFKRIAADSPNNAAVFVARILDAIATLKIFPHHNIVAGQSVRSKYPVRSLPVQSYIVFYRVIDEHRIVRVLQVRHGARKRPKRFRR